MGTMDVNTAYEAYLARFDGVFGDKAEGSFVKFGKHMVQKLNKSNFKRRLDHYLKMHAAGKQMLSSGATINDALVLEFEEAAAWLIIEAPDMMSMFNGEMGDPDIAKGVKR
jgi:hypothetical protein